MRTKRLGIFHMSYSTTDEMWSGWGLVTLKTLYFKFNKIRQVLLLQSLAKKTTTPKIHAAKLACVGSSTDNFSKLSCVILSFLSCPLRKIRLKQIQPEPLSSLFLLEQCEPVLVTHDVQQVSQQPLPGVCWVAFGASAHPPKVSRRI